MRSPRPSIDRARTLVAILVLFVIHLGVSPAPASASEYEYGVPTTCYGYNSGGRDASGRLYMPCTANKVRIVGVDGGVVDVDITPEARRIAPSPDGRYLYAIQENWSGRYVRQANGSYVRDTTFTFQRPALYVERGWPICGWGVATDGYGDVYLSVGGWCASANQILKYSPDGTLLTAFGDYGRSAIWEFRIDGIGANCAPGTARCKQVLKENHVGAVPGMFQANFTIGVTGDGARVWVADNNNMRIQWFDRRGGATYEYAGMWNGEGAMFPATVMGSSYGVAVDPWGYVYVGATTRQEVWRLNPDGTNPVLVAHNTNARPHTLAVDARGSVWVGEWRQRIDRVVPVGLPLPVLPPKPKIDQDAPVLAAVDAPAETFEQVVRVRLTASDDVGIDEMSIADESGEWGAWQPYRATFDHRLSPGFGYKSIYVRVRDQVRRESAVVHVRLRFVPVPDTTAPVVSIAQPEPTLATAILLDVTSSDDVGVTHLRIAGSDGTFGPWVTWASGVRTLHTVLEPDATTWTRYVQVRDAAWNTSSTAVATIRRPAPAPVVEPAPAVVGPVDDTAPTVNTDRVAPRVTSFVVPARSCGRRIRIRVVARDTGAVTHVRFANEDGRFGRWQRLRRAHVHVLTRGATRKLVSVQVRDAAGNVSRTASRRSLVVRCR